MVRADESTEIWRYPDEFVSTEYFIQMIQLCHSLMNTLCHIHKQNIFVIVMK